MHWKPKVRLRAELMASKGALWQLPITTAPTFFLFICFCLYQIILKAKFTWWLTQNSPHIWKSKVGYFWFEVSSCVWSWTTTVWEHNHQVFLKKEIVYRKVYYSMSRWVANTKFYWLFMKRKLDVYLLWPFWKKLIFEIVACMVYWCWGQSFTRGWVKFKIKTW